MALYIQELSEQFSGSIKRDIEAIAEIQEKILEIFAQTILKELEMLGCARISSKHLDLTLSQLLAGKELEKISHGDVVFQGDYRDCEYTRLLIPFFGWHITSAFRIYKFLLLFDVNIEIILTPKISTPQNTFGNLPVDVVQCVLSYVDTFEYFIDCVYTLISHYSFLQVTINQKHTNDETEICCSVPLRIFLFNSIWWGGKKRLTFSLVTIQQRINASNP